VAVGVLAAGTGGSTMAGVGVALAMLVGAGTGATWGAVCGLRASSC
jgi:hypothetical protein